MRPRLLLAILAGETEPTYWHTVNWQTFTRILNLGGHVEDQRLEVAYRDDLTVVGNGFNDCETYTYFPRHQHARFQPHRGHG
jgi:hypothetical protein